MPLRKVIQPENEAISVTQADMLLQNIKTNIYKTDDNTLRNINKCLTAYRASEQKEKLAQTYLLLARYCQLTNNYLAIFEFAEKIEECDVENDDLQCEVNALLSEAHLRLSSPGVALEHARKCLELAEKIDNKTHLAEAYVRLAEIYADLDRENHTLDYFNRAYDIIHEIHSPYTHLFILANLCDIRSAENKIEQAYELLRQIESLKDIFSNYLFVLAFDLRKARILAREKKFEEARETFNRVFDLAKKNDDHVRISNIEYDMAQMELESGNVEKAESMCRLSIREMSSVQVHLALDKRYKLLARIYETQGRLKDALDISKKLYYFKVGYLEKDLTKLLAYMRKASMYEGIKKEKEASDKIARLKDQFLANMSHEIRTPMNAIVGMGKLLEKTSLNEQQKKYAHGITQSADNLLVIINDILDFSKIEAGKVEFENVPFNLADVMQSVRDVLQFKADEKKLQFISEIASDVPLQLSGDPVRLNQVLINLAGNAIKFTNKGYVKMQCRLIGRDGDKAELHFEVSDTGIGISPDKLQDIFKSFTQASASTTRQFGGSGLGLTISKQLIQLQGGHIDVRSEPGKGSVFYFTINYKTVTPQKAEVKIDKAHKPISGLRILLAEDNAFNRIVAEDSLQEMIKDVQIKVAENGKDAIDLLEKNTFDIVLMDIQMPEMDGYEATRRIRASGKPYAAIPIIALTANAMKEEAERCANCGMNDFVSKPFDTAALYEKIVHQLNPSH